MPFTPMKGLELPKDEATVWRYMDFWKLKSLFETSSLYFVRSDRFKDSWDSVLPPKWREKMQRKMGPRPEGGTYTQAAWYEEREIPNNPIYCCNCDESESERMWGEYTTGADAFVIRTNVGRFKECFSSTTAQVRIGLVNYDGHEDLDDPKFSLAYWGNDRPVESLNPWYVSRYLKRKDLDYEKEIRATIHVDKNEQPIDNGYNLFIGSSGIRTLIEEIHMHPKATVIHQEKLESFLNQCGFCDIPIQASSLSGQNG